MPKSSIDTLRDELIQIENRNGVPRKDADFCLTLALRACREAVEDDRASRLAETVGRAQAEAEIADWLEGQAAGREDAMDGDWVRRAVADVEAATLRQAAEAVRQGRARRE